MRTNGKVHSLAPSQIPNDLGSGGSAVSHLSIGEDTSVRFCDVVESSIDSSTLLFDYAALSPSDIALLDGPDPEVPDSLLKIPKGEVNPFSLDPFEMDADMYHSLPSPTDPVVVMKTENCEGILDVFGPNSSKRF